MSAPRSWRFDALPLAVLLVASPAARPQELAALVPEDAFSLIRTRSDPSMDFVMEANEGVWKAIKEARFHETLLKALHAAGTAPADVERARGLFDLGATLLGNVAWEELVQNEMVYAEFAESPFDFAPMGVRSYVGAFRPAAASVPALERSLTDLLSGISLLSDDLSLVRAERPGDVPTRTCSLVLGGSQPLFELAVRGDVILLGIGAGPFQRSLALLEGRSEASLVRTSRFLGAVGESHLAASSLYYLDVERMVQGLIDSMGPQILKQAEGDWRVRQGLEDLRGLLDVVDTSVTTVRAEGRTVVSECWTRFDPAAAATSNPIFASFCQPGDVTGLMDYVPADALAFSVSGGIDLRPLCAWIAERMPTYVPEAADAMVLFNGVQAAFDLSLQDDLLSWLGSPSVVISLPAQRPILGGKDSVSICQLRDPAGARKVLARIEAVYEALVPPLLARLESELQGFQGSMALPRIEFGDAHGSVPGLKRLSVSISIPGFPLPPLPEMLYGVVGNQLIFTTSEEALLYVMGVAAGEADGWTDHPIMTAGRRPEGPVTSCSYQPVGDQLREVAMVMGAVGGFVTMGANQVAREDPQAAVFATLLADVLPAVTRILQSLDFLEDQVDYSELRNDGLISYSRSTLRFRDP